jgi:hypothetical protein
LFVPNEDQWKVCEASKPSVICKKAGLGKDWFTNQVREYSNDFPQIEDYLYNRCELPKEGSAGGYEPTPAPLEFRKRATIQKILRRAKRSNEQLQSQRGRRKCEYVTDALLSKLRREFQSYSWYDRWQLQGEKPPGNVMVVTARQARLASQAWDFARFCADLDFRPDGT